MSDTNQIVAVEPQGDPLIRMAIDKNLDIEKLEKLIQLKNEQDERQARAEYERHFAEMQAEFVPAKRIKKGYDYMYAPLEELQRTYGPVISKHGFSYRHREEMLEDGSKRCIMRISGWGHSEETSFDIPKIAGTKQMNPIQVVASMSTYGRRYTFIAGFGCVVEDEDDDGKAPPPQKNPESQALRKEVIGYIKSVSDKIPEANKKEVADWIVSSEFNINELTALKERVEQIVSQEPELPVSPPSDDPEIDDIASEAFDDGKSLELF
jgi:hypothetical protein